MNLQKLGADITCKTVVYFAGQFSALLRRPRRSTHMKTDNSKSTRTEDAPEMHCSRGIHLCKLFCTRESSGNPLLGADFRGPDCSFAFAAPLAT